MFIQKNGCGNLQLVKTRYQVIDLKHNQLGTRFYLSEGFFFESLSTSPNGV